MDEQKKMGRPPSGNPKAHKITIKLDSEAKNVLDTYCEQEAVSMSEASRRGLMKLKEDLKDK